MSTRRVTTALVLLGAIQASSSGPLPANGGGVADLSRVPDGTSDVGSSPSGVVPNRHPIPVVKSVEIPPSPASSRVPKYQHILKAFPTKTTPRVVGHSLVGKASWYCKAGVSACHYAYPPGSMVAAACWKLRRAIGAGKWRGRLVKVARSTTTFVWVRLVDSCASEDKTIDLYWEPMHRLGGTGVLTVKVSW